MNIEEAKEILDKSSKLHLQVDREPNKFDIAIETVLAELNKKDKIIDKMADEIYDLGQKQDERNDKFTIWVNKEHILNYFTNTEGDK